MLSIAQPFPSTVLVDGRVLYIVHGAPFEVDADYKITSIKGGGSSGLVCAAHDTSTGESIAIKKVSGIFDDLRQGQRILLEAKLMRRIQHPNLLHMKRILLPKSKESFSEIYFVSNLFDSNLSRIIHSPQGLTDAHIKYFLVQALRGLHYLHSARIFHRDLKPSNLLVNADCKLVIGDFGLSRIGDIPIHEEMTAYVVTRWYRAPELLVAAESYTAAVDIWSLGLIFAEMILRRILLPGKDYIEQLILILKLLGTPLEEDMIALSEDGKSFIRRLPLFSGYDFKSIFPTASPEALELLKLMLAFNPAKRITAKEALSHSYLASLQSTEESIASYPLMDEVPTIQSIESLREEFWKEIMYYTKNS